MLLGGSFCGFITQKLWVGSMIRKFYKVQRYFTDMTDFDPAKK